MKSDLCKLTRNTVSLKNILQESEKAAAYANLDKKEVLNLRLMAEELIGMLPELLDFSDGEFWIECEGKKFELHVSLVPNEALTFEKRERLLSVSSDGKNAAAVGIMSKIKIAATFMMIDYEKNFQTGSSFYSYGLGGNLDLQCPIWTLTNYRQNVSKEKDEKWDELEKSIIANIADDVSVGLQGSKVEITVKKTF